MFKLTNDTNQASATRDANLGLPAATASNIQPPSIKSQLADTLTTQGLTGRIGLSNNLFKALVKSGLGNRQTDQQLNAFTKLIKAKTIEEMPSEADLSSQCAPNQSLETKMFAAQQDRSSLNADHPSIGMTKEFCKKPFVQQVDHQNTQLQDRQKIQGVAKYLTEMLTNHEHNLESLNILLDRRFTTSEVLILLKALPQTPELTETRLNLAKHVVGRDMLLNVNAIQTIQSFPIDLQNNPEIRMMYAAVRGDDFGDGNDPTINRILDVRDDGTIYDRLTDDQKNNPYFALAGICSGDIEYSSVSDTLVYNRDFALMVCNVSAGDIPRAFFNDREFLLAAFPDRIADHRDGERYIPEECLNEIPAPLRNDYEVAKGLNSSGWSVQRDGDDEIMDMPLDVTSDNLKDNAEFMLLAQNLDGNSYLAPAEFLSFCSRRLQRDDGFMKAFLTSNMNLVGGSIGDGRKFGEICEELPPRLERDHAFNLSLLRKNFAYMPYVSVNLRNNPTFMLEALQIEPAAMHWAGPNLPAFVRDTANTEPTAFKRQKLG